MLIAQLIRVALSLIAGALVLFMLMTGMLRAGSLALAKLLLGISLDTALIGGMLLLLLGLGACLKQFWQQLRQYCSPLARVQRQIAYTNLQYQQQVRLHVAKRLQWRYFTQQKHQRLLQRYNISSPATRTLPRVKHTLRLW